LQPKKARTDAWTGALARTGFAYLTAAAKNATSTAAKLFNLF
jgi:hypothetical protein